MSAPMTPDGGGHGASGGAHRAEEVPVNGTGPDPQASRSAAEIEADIEQQREQLAQTLDALGAKLDVKAQAQARVQQAAEGTRHTVAGVRDRTTTDDGRPRPELLAAVLVAVAGAVGLVWWRRSR